MIVERVKNKDGPIAPKKFSRFLGPGFNQFQNWNNQNEDSGGDSPDEEEKLVAKKPSAQEDDEGWTDWKNGNDIRNRLSVKKKPGRIIRLGDGSEVFTDQNVDEEDDEHDGHNNQVEGSSSEEDSEEEEEEHEHDKMQVDGIKATASKTTAKPPQTRYKSPTPTEIGAPQSPSQK